MKEDTIKSTWSIRDCFQQLRMNEKNHQGLGDIRLTIGEQDEICELVERFYTPVDNEDTGFSVSTYSFATRPGYTHWSEGLNVVIKKDGVIINLTEDEIRQVINSLPRTVGGAY